jgi:hypothetical protein
MHGARGEEVNKVGDLKVMGECDLSVSKKKFMQSFCVY